MRGGILIAMLHVCDSHAARTRLQMPGFMHMLCRQRHMAWAERSSPHEHAGGGRSQAGRAYQVLVRWQRRYHSGVIALTPVQKRGAQQPC